MSGNLVRKSLFKVSLHDFLALPLKAQARRIDLYILYIITIMVIIKTALSRRIRCTHIYMHYAKYAIYGYYDLGAVLL